MSYPLIPFLTSLLPPHPSVPLHALLSSNCIVHHVHDPLVTSLLSLPSLLLSSEAIIPLLVLMCCVCSLFQRPRRGRGVGEQGERAQGSVTDCTQKKPSRYSVCACVRACACACGVYVCVRVRVCMYVLYVCAWILKRTSYEGGCVSFCRI